MYQGFRRCEPVDIAYKLLYTLASFFKDIVERARGAWFDWRYVLVHIRGQPICGYNTTRHCLGSGVSSPNFGVRSGCLSGNR